MRPMHTIASSNAATNQRTVTAARGRRPTARHTMRGTREPLKNETWPLARRRRNRVNRTAQCAGHQQRRSPPVDGHHEHDAGHAYDLLSRAFDLVEEFEDGDERAPVDGLDESFDWDVKRKVLLAGGRQCVDCEDGHAGEAEDKKGQGEWGHL